MVSKALQKLSEHALEALRQRSPQGAGQVRRMPWRRPMVEQFNYTGGEVSFSLKPRSIEREEWPLADQYRFVTQALKPLSSFAHCSEALARSLHLPREHVEPRLARYLQVLVSAYRETQDPSVLPTLSQQFLRELAGEPVHWTVQGALRGVVLEADQCQFGIYRLRRPVAGDFEVEQAVDDVGPHPLLAHPPSAFLEFEMSAHDHFEVRQRYARVLNLLRLYRLGSVGSSALRSTPRAVLHSGGALYCVAPPPTPYVYRLADADQGPLMRFVERHSAGPGALQLTGNAAAPPQNIEPALTAYTRALFSPGIESQVIWGLACLEALLLRPAEHTEANHRLLGRRVNALLGACGQPFDRACTALQEAYAARNVARHALEPVETARPGAVGGHRSLLESARLALIVCSQVGAPAAGTERLLYALEDPTGQLTRLLNGIELPP